MDRNHDTIGRASTLAPQNATNTPQQGFRKACSEHGGRAGGSAKAERKRRKKQRRRERKQLDNLISGLDSLGLARDAQQGRKREQKPQKAQTSEPVDNNRISNRTRAARARRGETLRAGRGIVDDDDDENAMEF
ncbi:hypothetical protein DM02DRAFT_731831 [Periconia macrospinosa]|uniref:Uncharacterized protein n=1 Tax=Periconia macrospinosa TaxID=97972 RepID=A0A2V1DBK3_9PLEO|nr:hypothetical protein DM02DRAFT_731831 [Periconia macrospinosa]